MNTGKYRGQDRSQNRGQDRGGDRVFLNITVKMIIHEKSKTIRESK